MKEIEILTGIPYNALFLPYFDMYTIYDNRDNAMTIVYDKGNKGNKIFSLHISLTSDKKGLITDNYTCTNRTPVNKIKKAIKAYLESYGYKVKLGKHPCSS